MPLYMDFHKIPNITIAEAKKAHVADEEIQRKYGVKYLQFWVNEEAGNLFCLVEGPDRATCESVHRMAHGHVACAIVEVDPSYYSLIMGENIRIDQGLVHDKNGSVDLGYRTILAVTLHEKPPGDMEGTRELIGKLLTNFSGRSVRRSGDDSFLSVFDSVANALGCAKEIQSVLPKSGHKGFSIGLGTGQPVTENNEFIAETIRLAECLSYAAVPGSIMISSLTNELADERVTGRKIRSVTGQDETFMTQLFGVIDQNLSDEDFSIEILGQGMGISRPQLYRRVRELTGKAPIDLIREIRLDKALSLLRRKTGKNIAETAFEVGFSNPSYFAKCFARKFGCQPSQFMAKALV